MSVVTVEGLSKRYILYHDRTKTGKPTTFREVVNKTITDLFRGSARQAEAIHSVEEFWALRDINFSVDEGTKLGIIGRNGAGKSTLLKILSRITEPTEGKVQLRGRAASLLEVGTGFHPELTGRENIFLNGALLGMSRAEIRRKLDEIVDFAGVEQFLDLPVKHYSSGMYVRLAFAVAAHVDPDILILDEVLAVGDLQFQRKCFGKMEQLGATARAVLFVTHDLSAVSSLCNRCLVLEGGRVLFDGAPSEAILRYYDLNPLESGKIDYSATSRHVGDADARLISAEVTLLDGTKTLEVDIAKPIRVAMRYCLNQTLGAPAVPNFHFFRADGTCAFIAQAPNVEPLPEGEYLGEVTIPGNFLNEGTYTIGFALTTFFKTYFSVHFYERNAIVVNVRDSRDDQSLRYGFAGEFMGVIRPKLDWRIKKVHQ